MTSTMSRAAVTQGHVALYSQDGAWCASVEESLHTAGHSTGRASRAEDIQELLVRQRFDVLALQVQDEAEGAAIAQALQDVPLPLHTIVMGNANALPLRLERRAGGTFRYVPGELTPEEVSRLVDVSIVSGAWDEPMTENGASAQLREIDLHDVIDRSASAVLKQAQRKKQSFRSDLIGEGSAAFGDKKRLIAALTSLLKIMVAAAPERAAIRADAEAREDEWLVRITSSLEDTASEGQQAVELLRDETKTLRDVAKTLRSQGGMLWVELQGSGLPGFALTVPTPPARRAAHEQSVALHGALEGGEAGRTM